MAFLLDTNCMWRRFVATDPDHLRVKSKVDALLREGEDLYITAQNMIEFHSLATRPTTSNGLGLSALAANEEAATIAALFALLPETPEIYTHWRALMARYPVHGRQAYDARLVAVMLAHGVTHIVTLNPSDFRRFSEIIVVEP